MKKRLGDQERIVECIKETRKEKGSGDENKWERGRREMMEKARK